MKIIVPMAGRGKRMRPHTLTVPKPLLPVAGKPIVQRLVEDIIRMSHEPIDEIAFVIGDFGAAVEQQLIGIAESLGAKGSIYYQDQPLGTAHAIMCAKESMDDHLIIAFADTLFRADFHLDPSADGVIYVERVDNPSAFGVVKYDDNQIITDFVEKPSTFVSDLAIIGIYYVKDGANLRKELQYLLDNDIRDKGEYQLTNALENMKNKGIQFKVGQVQEWLDCGNYAATVFTNQRVLATLQDEPLIAGSARIAQSTIIEPCFIGENVVIQNSVVGPYVSLGDGCTVTDSILKNSIVQENSHLTNKLISDSMIGNEVTLQGHFEELSIGDFSTQQ